MKKPETQLKNIITLAFPIMLMTFSQLGMGVVDTVVSSLSSTTDVAAIGLGTAIWSPIFLSATTIVSALTIVNAGHYAQKRTADAGMAFVHSVLISALLSAVIILFLVLSDWWLGAFVSEPNIRTITDDYLLYVAPSIVFALLFQVFRSDMEAQKIVKTSMTVYVIGLLLNIPLSLFFALGYGAFEGFGAAGCGIATSIAFFVMMILQFRIWQKNTPHHRLNVSVNLGLIAQLLKLGLPMGASTAMEIGMFSVVTLLIAHYGETVLAAHQITMSITATIFAIPIAIASALTILIARECENGEQAALKNTAFSGLALGFACILTTSTLAIYFAHHIVGWYSDDTAVITAAVVFVTWACIYQIFDMFQAVFIGILRGFSDTTMPFIYMLAGSWLVAIPCGYALAHYAHNGAEMPAVGFYQGLFIGLIAVCVALFLRFRKTLASSSTISNGG